MLVLTDISERERRERAEREFVTNAAHELRTPLTTITGAVEVLQAGAKDGPRSATASSPNRARGDAARPPDHALLSWRARRPARRRRASRRSRCGPLLEEVIAALPERERRRDRLECPPGLAVLAERDLAEQAIANLAANALKHTEHGAGRASAPARRAAASRSRSHDTGPGIPVGASRSGSSTASTAATAGGGGFGLGLAIVREAVGALGGTVEIESRPGRGTTARSPARGARRRAQ